MVSSITLKFIAFVLLIWPDSGLSQVVVSVGVCPTRPDFSTTLPPTTSISTSSTQGNLSSASSTLPSLSISTLPANGTQGTGTGASPTAAGGNVTLEGGVPGTAPSALPSAFLIGIGPAGSNTRRRRKSNPRGFLNYKGQTVDDCRYSSIFSVSDGYILSAQGHGVISTDYQTQMQPFVPSETIKLIYAIWSYENGLLHWEDTSFINGKAAFCLAASIVDIYFTIPPPANCALLQLGIEPLSACPGWVGPDGNKTKTTSSSSYSSPSIITLPTNVSLGIPSGTSIGIPLGNSTVTFGTTAPPILPSVPAGGVIGRR